MAHCWCWKGNDGSYKPYKPNVSQEIDKLSIGECYSVMFGSTQYLIQKESDKVCKQINTKTNFSREVILQEMANTYNQNNYNQNDKKINGWYWKSNYGEWKPYQTNVSDSLTRLSIGKVYNITFGNTQYEIKKISNVQCDQINLKTGYKREVIYHQSDESKASLFQNNINDTNDINDINDNNHNNDNGFSWFWINNNNQYIPYSADVCQEIENLQINESYFMFDNNQQFEITKLKLDKAQQMNYNTGNSVSVVRKGGFINNNDNNNANKNQYETKYNDNYNNGDDNKEDLDQWYWKSGRGEWKKMDVVLSQRVNDLMIGDQIITYIHGLKYEITKTSVDKGQQRNCESDHKRPIQRPKYKWYISLNGNGYKPYSDYAPYIDDNLNKMNVGDSWIYKPPNINRTSYRITKTSVDKGNQRNIESNKVRQIVRKLGFDENRNNDKNDNDDEKSVIEKWLWKSDSGYKPMNDEISRKLSQMTIGDIESIKIKGVKYDFRKTTMTLVQQKNTQTKKCRNCRVAEYGWFYESTKDKSLKQYSKHLNAKINSTKIGESITFSISNTKYELKRISMNKAEQKNLSTGFKRNVIRKMTLNDDDDDDGNDYDNNNNNKNGDNKGASINKKEVEKLFFSTVSSASYKIVEIKNLSYNNDMGNTYEAILKAKCKKGKKRKDIERYLWHGTKNVANLQLIIKNGFDRSFNTTAAYGKGTYFARDANYSVSGGYCGQDSNGHHCILLCKVIVGQYVKGTNATTSIPKKPDGSEYESLVNNTSNPSIFVIWRDYHAVPMYLLKYKK